MLAALITAAIACTLLAGPALAATSGGNAPSGPRIGHLEVGHALQPAALRSRADTTEGWCAAEISYWEYVECPSIAPPGAELENTSRENDGLSIWACAYAEDPEFCHTQIGYDLSLDSRGDTGFAVMDEGDQVIMSGHDLFEEVPVAASIVVSSSAAAAQAATAVAPDAVRRRLYRSKTDALQGIALAKLRSKETEANAAIDRYNRLRATVAAVRAKVGTARSAATSLHRLLGGHRPRTPKGAKAKAALLGVLRDEASACRQLDLALNGVTGPAGNAPAERSIAHANVELRRAASEARAAVEIVTGH